MIQRALKLSIILVLILSLGFVAQYSGVLARLRSATSQATRKTGQAAAGAVTTTFHLPSAIKSLRRLEAERADLADQVVQLTVENADLHQQLLIKQAEQTENAVQYTEPIKKQIGAHVIGREPELVVQYLRLDQGANQGVQNGMAVTSNGILIGRINQTFPSESTAIVITSYLSVIQVRHESSRTTAIARGGLDGLHIESIPLDVKLNKGDRIVTSGLDGVLPPGLVVGTIDEVLSDESSFLQSAKISQPIQARRLEFVDIVGRQ